jgi:hypothetical protein
MNFYEELDAVMKQDFGNRGLLASLPPSPAAETAGSLCGAKRVLLLTGFPVRTGKDSFTGETDGPSGTANLAAALTGAGCQALVVTDAASAPLLKAALDFRAPKAGLLILPETGTDAFIRSCIRDFSPTHFISLERPGKAADGHYHNMRGEIIDDMVTDSALFLSEAGKSGAVTISIGDGGNEMGMGAFEQEIRSHVPCGQAICASESAMFTLAAGVSNWWGWGIASLLSVMCGKDLLPSEDEEAEMLRRVVAAGGVDGCTKKPEATVDALPLSLHLSLLRTVRSLTETAMKGAARETA